MAAAATSPSPNCSGAKLEISAAKACERLHSSPIAFAASSASLVCCGARQRGQCHQNCGASKLVVDRLGNGERLAHLLRG